MMSMLEFFHVVVPGWPGTWLGWVLGVGSVCSAVILSAEDVWVEWFGYVYVALALGLLTLV